MKTIASCTFGFIRCAGLGRHSPEERALARTCRLVCRDWARELPLGDPQLKVAEGAVWYRFEGGWQHLPKIYWAWKRQELEWWMEPRQQDRPSWVYQRKDRAMCETWYPRVSVIEGL